MWGDDEHSHEVVVYTYYEVFSFKWSLVDDIVMITSVDKMASIMQMYEIVMIIHVNVLEKITLELGNRNVDFHLWWSLQIVM